ncbi:MAG: hypothetical protein Q7S96_02535 [bacterium]|nr:hypothetical protein [bacterium]
MLDLKRTLLAKELFLAAIIFYAMAWLIGGIFGDALKLIGFIALAMAIIAAIREVRREAADKSKK